MLWRKAHERTRAPRDDQDATGSALQRRGALAGFAVLMAGLLAKASELPARAADGDPLLLGRGNQADSRTQLDRSSTVKDTALVVTNTNGPAIQATAHGDNSASAEGAGVIGQGDGVGVWGEAGGFSGIAGVFGIGRATGVTGFSVDGTGVTGGGGVAGVSGFAHDSGGNGVFGQGALAGAGVFGQAAQSPNPNTYGVFSAGRFGATGPITALIRGTDGVQRVAFDVASPDSWIVDVGSATLQRGRATVPLAPDVAPLIDTSTYQVFVSPYGPTRGLFVSRRTPTSFEVQASHEGDHGGDIAFAFQVVGKRKDVSVSRPSAAPADIQPTPSRRPDLPDMPELERRGRGDR